METKIMSETFTKSAQPLSRSRIRFFRRRIPSLGVWFRLLPTVVTRTYIMYARIHIPADIHTHHAHTSRALLSCRIGRCRDTLPNSHIIIVTRGFFCDAEHYYKHVGLSFSPTHTWNDTVVVSNVLPHQRHAVQPIYIVQTTTNSSQMHPVHTRYIQSKPVHSTPSCHTSRLPSGIQGCTNGQTKMTRNTTEGIAFHRSEHLSSQPSLGSVI